MPWVSMGIIKDRHGTYYVQRRVPTHLQEAVAHVLNSDGPRRVFLKKSLGTKNLKEAKAAAPHVLADFSRIIGEAEAFLKEQPLIAVLADTQIKRMQVSNVQELEGVRLLYVTANRRAGKRVKTKASERVVPIHPELVKLGLLDYVAKRALDGPEAWLFPAVAPDQRRALAAWSKWFGQYLRKPIGVTNPDRVFHSFRHSFQDALRRATPDAELRDVRELNEYLAKQTFGGGCVHRGYLRIFQNGDDPRFKWDRGGRL